MMQAANKSSRKIPHCTLCTNHGETVEKKGHNCKYKDCKCVLCTLSMKVRTIMRLQLAFWRHIGTKIRKRDQLENKQRCDNCRNHLVVVEKRGHKNKCPYAKCKCAYCVLTAHRRELMKRIQRVKRSNIIISSAETNEVLKNIEKDSSMKHGDLDVSKLKCDLKDPKSMRVNRSIERIIDKNSSSYIYNFDSKDASSSSDESDMEIITIEDSPRSVKKEDRQESAHCLLAENEKAKVSIFLSWKSSCKC